MEIFLYVLIFIMGTFFGSFYTLAVYRIPLGMDIFIKHSFCPNCNEKLGIRDLIPVLSYVFLGGKCRHCGQKIRIRYLILELLSGFVFLGLALSLKADIFNLNYNIAIYFAFYVLYFSCLFIIAGIDKETNTIQKAVLLYGLIVSICYMIYVCIVSKEVIYTYIIILVGVIFLLIVDSIFLKKKLSENYTINILILCLLMMTFSHGEVFYYTVAFSLLLIAGKLLIDRLKNKEKKKAIIDTKKAELNIPVRILFMYF